MNWSSARTEWVSGKDPEDQDLHKVPELGAVLVGAFLVWDGRDIGMATFTRLPRPKKEGGGYYSGYWRVGRVKAWMPLPEPPHD